METVPNSVVVPQFETSLPPAPRSISIPVNDTPSNANHEAPTQQLNRKAFSELFGLIRQGAKDLLQCTSNRGDGVFGPITSRDKPSTPLTAEQILALLDESELEAMAKISNTIGHNVARIMFMADSRGDKADHRSRSRLRRRLDYAGSSKHDKLTIFSTTSHRRHCHSSAPPSLSLDRSPAPQQDEEYKMDEDEQEPLGLRLQVVCHECRAETTPRWRKGPDGPGTLCNVCGLLYAKRMRRLVYTEHSFRRRGRRIR